MFKKNCKNSVAILLCTFQGEKYLSAQLNSFLSQSYKHWNLYVSDDYSTDSTASILEKFNKIENKANLITLGPRQGFAVNFFSLTNHPKVVAEFYAWSDQDDIWHKDKLMRAVNWLNKQPKNKPALFCSRTSYVNHNNKIIGYSPLFKKPKTFKNALVQNVAGGNTMVFNQKAKDLFLKIKKVQSIVSHDWTMYQIVTACGGQVFYDPMPLVRYRQHISNVIGENFDWYAKINHFKINLKGRSKRWNTQNTKILKVLKVYMAQSNYETFKLWVNIRHASLFKRMYLLRKSGIFCQTLFHNIMLYFFVLINKL